MSAVATPTRTPQAPERTPVTAARPEPAGGRRPFDDRATLERFVLGAWEGLVVGGRCACPVCSGPMADRPAGGAPSSRGVCGRCGAELA
jgi:hypothetical protein